MADSFTRQSPGIWKNNRTGQIVRSASDPGKAAPKPTTPAKPKPGQTSILPNNTAITNVAQGVNANATVANKEADKNININNPNYVGPDGSSTVTIGPDGKPVYNVNRSQSQQDIAAGLDSLSKQGIGYAGNALNNLGQYDRQKVEDSVYNSLTRDVGRSEQAEQQDITQSLANRGIAYSNDPNSRYQMEMKDFQNKYSDIRQNARNQAVLTGGSEGRADYGTQMQGIQSASNLGGGLRDVGNPSYSGTQVEYGNPTDIDAALKALGISKEQVDLARRKAASGGGANNSGSTSGSPFGG